MSTDKKSVVRDRVTTTDASGHRVGVYAMAVPPQSFWNRRRVFVQWSMILLYLAVPWIKIGGHPLLLIDIEHRRFSVFGQLFFAHEVPYLVFLIVAFLMGIALVTTILGRAWCGWTCPQTVFIERLFRYMERLIEGDHLAQKKLDESPWGFNKFVIKSWKWFVFTFIALILSHSFLGYFVGGTQAFTMMTTSPSEHPQAFFWVVFMVGLVLFDFGWFREQFCLIACPYGRFQSVMMDEGSLFLAYDKARGDCIECMKCVKVCPTGIDVRNGLQFECIACTACADACDDVMEKINKPKKLVGYGSLNSLAGQATRFIRGRTVIYGSVLIVALAGLFWTLSKRQTLQSEVTRAVDTPYQVVELNGQKWVINHFKVRFYNLDWVSHHPEFQLLPGVGVAGAELIQSGEPVNRVMSGQQVEKQFFIKFPLQAFQEALSPGRSPTVTVATRWPESEAKSGPEQSLDATQNLSEVKLVGPGR
jgi:cytochrome c oxidase accessory protein FixG